MFTLNPLWNPRIIAPLEAFKKKLKVKKLLLMFLKSNTLFKEKFTYEIYQEERKFITNKRALTPTYDEPRKKRKLAE